ncbi:hypothetical protein VXQ18_00505 [Brucella abortus]|nr:hypothetical protein [Brucella abortus]
MADSAFHDEELRPVFDLIGKGGDATAGNALTVRRRKRASSTISTWRHSMVSASSAARSSLAISGAIALY